MAPQDFLLGSGTFKTVERAADLRSDLVDLGREVEILGRDKPLRCLGHYAEVRR